ncbi:MAG TPA: hypothetical protein ENF73_04130 [Proteobacteria bacterium]|nr:hypothetical protein [Pseudomonadota bacterium]
MSRKFAETLRSRPFRLIVLVLFFAAFFAHARLLFLLALGLAIFASAVRHFSWGRRVLDILVFMALAAIAVQLLAYRHAVKVRNFVESMSPVSLEEVPDGAYVGEAWGANGPISVRVVVKDHRFERLDLLSYREQVYAFDDVIAHLRELKNTDLSEFYPFAFRGWIAVAGLQRAIENAILTQHPRYPKPPRWVAAVYRLASHRPDKIAFNALFVLFIVFLAFDYSLGPVLFEGTGQSLNCYNCQACVGVCPVKQVGEYAFPITLVVEARLGRFDRVRELAKYCVACGRCAGKCPVGNSAPSIAAACVIISKKRKAAGV